MFYLTEVIIPFVLVSSALPSLYLTHDRGPAINPLRPRFFLHHIFSPERRQHFESQIIRILIKCYKTIYVCIPYKIIFPKSCVFM